MNFKNFGKRETPWMGSMIEKLWENDKKMDEIMKYHEEYAEFMKTKENEESQSFPDFEAMEELWGNDEKMKEIVEYFKNHQNKEFNPWDLGMMKTPWGNKKE